MENDFEEWRAQYPDGTRILWLLQYPKDPKATWLPGRITGTGFYGGTMTLEFRLDSDSPRAHLPRILSIKNKHLLKKEGTRNVIGGKG